MDRASCAVSPGASMLSRSFWRAGPTRCWLDHRGAKPACPARRVVGFPSQISHYMQVSDFFIGKPGPGSISEAVQQGLPVIVVRNAWTMLQERYNTDWVQEHGAGIVL